MVCPLELPALRDRAGDVAALFSHFWRERGETRPLDAGVLELLNAYAWPGNVRELENLVERVSVLAEGAVVRVEDIPAQVRPGAPRPSRPVSRPSSIDPPPPTWTPPPLSLPPAPAWAPPPTHEAPRAPPTPPPPTPLFEAPPPAPAARGTPPPAPTPPVTFPVDLPSLLRRLEDEYIDAALQQAQGNKKAAADLLGLQRTTLVEKLRRRSREAPTSVESLPLASGV
jgi:sigma-54 specific flagellar transcriptional regulator A